jgi:uncharacterized repeat protein (TIGR01451 family)
VVTQNCPVSPVIPGGLLTYTGTVRNAGNITLTNVVVLNNLSGVNPVLTVATLAPGAVANFTGSYQAPTNCSSTSIATATARSVCGVAVTGTVTASCPITTIPQIVVTAVCPPTPVLPGGSVAYSGTVRNTGNITLTNVVVISDRPAANSTVFTVAALAPGASASFTGTYTVPTNVCVVTTTFSGSARDLCTTAMVTNTVSTTCTVTTAPAIAVTLACPVVTATAGGLITYTGTVRNSGNITLNNVTVVNSQAVPGTVLTLPSLAPGASANFTATFTAPADACTVRSTVTATGNDLCTAAVVSSSASATCPLLATPGIDILQNCPVSPALPGGLVTYSGTVRNTGNITLTNVVVTRGGTGITIPIVITSPSTNITTNTVLWVDDLVPARGMVTSSGGDSWKWVTSNPTPFSGTAAHQSSISPGFHQHTFRLTIEPLSVSTGDTMIAYVYLDPTYVPTEVMLGWHDGYYEHRAYWGANRIDLGTDGTETRRYMGPLPAVGQWVRLEVPASAVGLEGLTLNGMSFNLYDGRATWDAAGLTTMGATSVPIPPIQPQTNGTMVFTVATLAPGASANFTTSYTVPENACSFTSTLAAAAVNPCTGTLVITNVTTTCPIPTLPAIVVTQSCPTTPVTQGSILTYSGTVSNAGNVTLTNIVVVNNWPIPNLVIFTAPSLAPGATLNFTGSYQVPLNCCVAWSTVRASGQGCDGVTVTDTDSGTCAVFTAPQIVVTKVCPPMALRPGAVLEYSGTVSNAGNISLLNVTLVNNQPSVGSTIFGPVTLAPGESANYYASYIVPPDFCGTDTVTARGLDGCSFAPVVSSVTTTCPIITAPRIAISKHCPPMPTPHGAPLVFSGTVSNLGNVTLINVFVVNNQPSNNTPVIGPITLAPGGFLNFSGSYIAPVLCCEMTDTLTVRGQDRCTGSNLLATATAICPLLYTPGIALVQTCPPIPLPMGGVYSFSGFVTNTGDAILTNVMVFGTQAGVNLPLLGPIDLAPGEKEPYSGSVTVPSNSCAVTVTVTSQETCKGTWVTNTTACPIATTPRLMLSQICVANPVRLGGLLSFSGTVSNAGDITLNNIVVTNSRTGNTPLVTIATLAPGASANFGGSFLSQAVGLTTSTSTGHATSLCNAPVQNTASSACLTLTTPAIAVTKLCPPAPVAPGATLVFSGTVTNTGDITLTNVFVVNNRPVPNTVVLGPITLAAGAGTSFTGSYLAPLNACTTSDTLTSTGSDVSNGSVITNTASASCNLVTTPRIVVTQNCPVTPVTPGSLFTYSGTVSNAGNITLNNIVVTNSLSGTTPVLSVPILAPGASVGFTGSYQAPATGPTASTSSARATSLCGATVTGAAGSTCPIVSTPGITVIKLCPPVPVASGSTLVFSGAVANTGNVTLTNVFVVNSQPVPNTPVLGPITLAPGERTNFTGSYIVPMNTCSSTDTLTGRGSDANTGIAITNTISATCPILTTPGITVTEICPPGPVSAGSSVVFMGLVGNTGNITLTNVLVFSAQSSNSTPVLGPLTLTPGASALFTGNYLATGGSNPATNTTIVTNGSTTITTNVANLITTNVSNLIITNVANLVTTNVSSLIVTNAANLITTNVANLITTNVSSLIITNAANLITTNVSNLIITNVADLITTNVANLITTNVADLITTNVANLITTNVANLITTNSTVSVTTNPPTPTTFATVDSVAGTTVDRFVMGTNFNGLTYAGEDHGYGATELYSMRKDSSGTSFFDTIIPSTHTTTDRFPATTRNFDSLVYAANDMGYGPLLFYYLSHDAGGVSSFGTLSPGGVTGVTTDRFVVGTNFDALTYTATDLGFGANMFYYLRHDANGLSTFGTINPALPGTVTDRFTVGTNFDALAFTDLVTPGYGANNFYYLRHDTNGVSTFGTIFVTSLTTAAVTDRFTVGTNATDLAFTATDTGFGANLFYLIRGSGLSYTTNALTTFTTNALTTFTTNTLTTFTTNALTTFTTNTLTTFTTNALTTFTTNTLTTFTTNTLTTFTTNTLTTFTTNALTTFTTNTLTTFTTNALTTFTTNTLTTFATNTLTTFTTNSLVTFTATNTVTAVGVDVCQARTVSAAADCLGPIVLANPVNSAGLPYVPVIGRPSLASGYFGLSIPTESGKWYTVQYKQSLSDPAWTDLETIVGTGTNVSITDAGSTDQPRRFYRVLTTQ